MLGVVVFSGITFPSRPTGAIEVLEISFALAKDNDVGMETIQILESQRTFKAQTASATSFQATVTL